MSAPASAAFGGLHELRGGEVASFAFADEPAAVYGYGRVEVDAKAKLARSLVAVFAAERPLAVLTGEAPVAASAADSLQAGPLRLVDHDGAWSAHFDGGADGVGAFTLRSEPAGGWLAVGGPESERRLARVGVTGEVQTAGGAVAVQGDGQLTFARDPDGAGAGIRRDVAVWVPDRTVDLSAVARKAGKGHDGEAVRAAIVDAVPPVAQLIEEPRLSTTYDADGRPLRVGIELWVTEESAYARRAAGDTLGAATLATPAGRWDCAFLRWRMEGDAGIGPYALWRDAKR